MVQLLNLYVTTRKTMPLTRGITIGKVMSLLFDMLSRFVSFSSKKQMSFNFMAAVSISSDFRAQENKVCHCFRCLPIYSPWSDGTRCHDLRFLNLSFKPTFLLSSFTFIKRLFSSSSLSAIRVVSSAYLRWLIFLPASWFQPVLLPAQHFEWCTLHIG